MRGAVSLRIGVGVVLSLGLVLGLVSAVISCGTVPTPFVVTGPGQFGNDPPTLDILEPNDHLTVGQGDPFLIRWTDRDRDNSAVINFSLLPVGTNEEVLLISNIAEDDTVGQDAFTVSTALIPPGTYHLRGMIEDGVNAPVDEFASVTDTALVERVVITVVGPGETPPTVPPVITATEPSFNLSVAQEDLITIQVQPTSLPPSMNSPFDPDSDVRLFILLDMDLNPTNDDPANPARACAGGVLAGEQCIIDDDCAGGSCMPDGIIVLVDQVIPAATFETLEFPETIDLATIPARANGEPYYIRATVDDATNPRVHGYAPGSISVVRLAAGIVDLFDIGRTKSGAKFQGFSPGANLGSTLSTVSDFDADGVDDFVLVAQFGNPQNVGPVGEAYLVYGQGRIVEGSPVPVAGNRFGGTIPVNSVGSMVSGVAFHAPPKRNSQLWRRCHFDFYSEAGARTEGITDVNFIRDLSGDGRPEILFGLPHVHGAFDSTDYDPRDEDIAAACGCFPDFLVNNLSESDRADPVDIQWYAGGMAVIVNSQNRDNSGLLNPDRLERTAVTLELVGQRAPIALDAGGTSETGNIFPRADNDGVEDIGSDPEEAGRIAGARFIAGGFDFEDPFSLGQPPREGSFGQSVASVGDLNSDTVDEVIISSPRNERYLADLVQTYGFFSTHLQSTVWEGSIVVLPGANYNQEFWRDTDDDEGTARIPLLDHHLIPPFGRCTNPKEWRHYMVPADGFSIFAEDIDDMLGDGQSAGDFNQDGLDDILCGAPRNDRANGLEDTGATYIIYGREFFGEVRLTNADDIVLRPPMLRVRGFEYGDRIGWQQEAGLDVNGDRIDDVFIASPHADFGNVTRAGLCRGDFNRDGTIDQTDVSLLSFNRCQQDFGEHLFSDDVCKVFDYDNDEDIDEDDRCVFCCLSNDCEPDPSCMFGRGNDCCGHLVDNGFIGVIFGGERINGDRVVTGDRESSQLATSELPGAIFYGNCALDRAGFDISSAGDFNQDGFGDLLIAAPGEVRCDRPISATCDAEQREQTCTDAGGRERLGVVYLVFGGIHLTNTAWNLKDVGSEELPGIVFLSPYVKGRPNEAAPTAVANLGDINNDGFGDIAIGNPKADFIDPSFPQGPDAPGSDPATGRRSDVGDAYVIYGSNFGSNRAMVP